jgi:hypothetical protein
MRVQTHLTHRLFFIGFFSLFLGCSVYIGPSPSWKTRTIPKPEGALTPAITAAGSIAFSDDRNTALTTVAENQKLSEPEQLYLLAVLRKLNGFSSDLSKVLSALAENPAATKATRSGIAQLVSDLSLFSSDASRVTSALAKR